MLLDALMHPSLTDENYTTQMLTWFDGRLHFFERMPLSANGTILLDTYYFAYALEMLTVYLFARWYQSRGSFHVKRYQVYDLTLIGTVGVLLGAKVFYVLFYNLEWYLKHPADIFLNWSGMASHGAMAGVAIGIWLWCRRTKVKYLHVVDNAVVAAAMGAVYIRFANYLNGELFGRSASPDLPWAMRFPMRAKEGQELFTDAAGHIYKLVRHDPQSREVLEKPFLEALKDPVHHACESFSFVQQHLPQQMGRYYVGSGDGPVIPAARLITDPSHPSQIYQLLIEGVLLVIVLMLVRLKAKQVGTLTGVFFVGYGVARIIGESFRQQDPQRADGLFRHISMGQLFSVVLIAVGIAIFWYRRLHPLAIKDLPMPGTSER